MVLKPLPIARLKRFMKAWGEFSNVKSEEEGFDIFINCAGIALENNYRDKFDTLKANKEEQEEGEYLSPEYKDYLEDTLDLDTIYLVLEVAGGLKLNDPKLLEAAEAALRDQAGTN